MTCFVNCTKLNKKVVNNGRIQGRKGTKEISRFTDEAGNSSFVLAKQFLCLDKNGKIVIKYSKNAINFYSLRSVREAAEMLSNVADKFDKFEA